MEEEDDKNEEEDNKNEDKNEKQKNEILERVLAYKNDPFINIKFTNLKREN